MIEINESYKRTLLKEWAPVIDVEGLDKVKNESVRTGLAQVLENTFKDLKRSGFNPAVLTEAAVSIDGSVRNGSANAITATQQDWKQGDVRIPLAIIPLARRMFTQLIAHEIVGVQAMASPTGYAAAFRYTYGNNVNGATVGDEIVFDSFKPEFSGASETTTATATENDNVQTSLGTTLAQLGITATTTGTAAGAYATTFTRTVGADVATGENRSFNPGTGETQIPLASMKLEKVLVEAKTRKIGTSISMEAAEDTLVSLGLDVNEAMVDILATDIKNSIDRELVQEIVLGCVGTDAKRAKALSTFDLATADGLDQLGRLSALYTHILKASKKIQFNSKMGNGANWMISSSPVSALIERIGDWKLADNENDIDGAAIAYAGTLRKGSIKMYNDALTNADYILLGWKGQAITQTGVVYAPYIPAQILSAPDVDKFGARLMARSRYAIVNSLWGTENFYQFIDVKNATGEVYGAIPGTAGASKKFATI